MTRRRAERYAEVMRETRSFRAEVRESDNGALHFEGHASTWDWYTVEDMFGEYEEQFVEGAFSKTLAERDDVVLLINHEGLPLARHPGTLDIREDKRGLYTASDLEPADPDVQRIKPKMDRGDLSQMSIAFRAMKQEWNEDYTERRILEARLYDVSIVTSPANPYTSAGIRGIDALRVLASQDPEELMVAVRSAEALPSIAQVRALLDSLDLLLHPRDMHTSMSRDKARRFLELQAIAS